MQLRTARKERTNERGFWFCFDYKQNNYLTIINVQSITSNALLACVERRIRTERAGAHDISAKEATERRR